MVIGVAGPASHARIVLLQISVQCGWVLPLGGDICMAGHTAISHGCRLPERHMAGGAFAAKVGMGRYSTQRCSSLGVKRTRTKEGATAHEAHHNHDQDSQQGYDKAGSGQAAKRLLFYHSTSIATKWRNKAPHRCG